MAGCHRWLGFARLLRNPITVQAFAATGGDPAVALAYTASITADTGDLSPWSAAINGSPVGITALTTTGPVSLEFTLASAPTTGDTVEITYDPPPDTLLVDPGPGPAKAHTASTTAS